MISQTKKTKLSVMPPFTLEVLAFDVQSGERRKQVGKFTNIAFGQLSVKYRTVDHQTSCKDACACMRDCSRMRVCL